MLTGFQVPYRAHPGLVDTGLDDRFPAILEPPPADEVRVLVRNLADSGIVGGPACDGLVTPTARRAKATLVKADRRAESTYAAVGVETRLIG